MSYKLSLIISMLFVSLFSFFAIDLIVIQNSYSLLDSKSINISYFLAKTEFVGRAAVKYIESTYDVEFTLLSALYPAFGDDIIYNISSTCKTFTMGSNLKITIQRMTVAGYYN